MIAMIDYLNSEGRVQKSKYVYFVAFVILFLYRYNFLINICYNFILLFCGSFNVRGNTLIFKVVFIYSDGISAAPTNSLAQILGKFLWKSSEGTEVILFGLFLDTDSESPPMT